MVRLPVYPPTSAPRDVPENERPVPREMEVVAIEPSLAGVPLVVVQYGMLPAVSAEEVAMYERSEIVPVLVMVPPERPVPAMMEETEEDVATQAGAPLVQPRTWPPEPEP